MVSDQLRCVKEKVKVLIKENKSTGSVGIGNNEIIVSVPFKHNILNIYEIDSIKIQWRIIGPAYALGNEKFLGRGRF